MEISCSFCDRGKIVCWHISSVLAIKQKSMRALLGPGSSHKSVEFWLIKSGCNVCGKSQEEVEKELKMKKII